MALTAKGLIIREHNVGEADRFVTVLTDRLGVIRASVRGARRVNSRAGASTRLLSFSQLSLVKGREKYIIDTAVPLRVFFAIGADMESIALAQYFCELFGAAAPREEEAEAFLRLLLNALHLLEQKQERERIKAVTELRLSVMAGYMPDLNVCRCRNEQPKALWFLPQSGVLCCENCLPREREHGAGEGKGAVPLSGTLLAAMRHIVYKEQRCFSFRLPQADCQALSAITERFLLCQLSRSFKTLEFYHSLNDCLGYT